MHYDGDTLNKLVFIFLMVCGPEMYSVSLIAKKHDTCGKLGGLTFKREIKMEEARSHANIYYQGSKLTLAPSPEATGNRGG